MVGENVKGLILAVGSSVFIGTSFILKKKGLRRAAANGTRAGFGGYTYLLEPLWWAGMVIMLVGEVANFVAYVFAPAVLVTPLGALSIIISAVLAHFILKERLPKLGILGCVSCIVGSVVIVLHAPQEQSPTSVQQIWALATQPAFMVYVAASLSIVAALILHFEPRYGQSNVIVYLGICSLMGSLTVINFSDTMSIGLLCLLLLVLIVNQRNLMSSLQVVSIKAIGIAIKLTLEGTNQLTFPQTWFFMTIGAICVVTQLNYLNKALDTFNAAIVSPIYYVMFTTLTIAASAIMFKDWSGQDASSIASEICGFITVLSGTIILHATREQEQANSSADLTANAGLVNWYQEGQKSSEEERLITLHNTDYFE